MKCIERKYVELDFSVPETKSTIGQQRDVYFTVLKYHYSADINIVEILTLQQSNAAKFDSNWKTKLTADFAPPRLCDIS